MGVPHCLMFSLSGRLAHIATEDMPNQDGPSHWQMYSILYITVYIYIQVVFWQDHADKADTAFLETPVVGSLEVDIANISKQF